MGRAESSRPTAEQMLAKLQTEQRARLRIYIGAAPGVGKTYSMIEDAHTFRREGVDVVIGFVETHGRADTEARIGDLEIVPRRRIDYRGVVLEEMDVDAILARKPALCVVDELAHTNVAGSRHEKRYQDVLELLDAGIGVMTAVNIQHLETLNDAVSRVTGVRVRETVPDTFLDRADEVVERGRDGRGTAQPPAPGQGLQAGEGRAGAGELLSRNQHLDAARAGAARRGRRDRRQGRVTPAARRAGAGAHPRARDGVHELERRRAAGAPRRRPDRGTSGRALVRRLRRDAARGARPHQAAATATRCSATSRWPRNWAPPSCA